MMHLSLYNVIYGPLLTQPARTASAFAELASYDIVYEQTEFIRLLYRIYTSKLAITTICIRLSS